MRAVDPRFEATVIAALYGLRACSRDTAVSTGGLAKHLARTGHPLIADWIKTYQGRTVLASYHVSLDRRTVLWFVPQSETLKGKANHARD